VEDENDFLLDDYHSEDEAAKVPDRRDVVGGGNMAPEVLKMLQQMQTSARPEKEEDEPDEIKVSNQITHE
jgi:hypothetical protein